MAGGEFLRAVKLINHFNKIHVLPNFLKITRGWRESRKI